MTSEEYIYDIKIPKERVGVLIGVKGSEKRYIEEHTNTKLNIDSKEGDVVITGSDGLGLYTAREIIKAIARGFNPDIAKLLLNEDYIFESIDVSMYTGKSKSAVQKVKGRIIGSGGKSRKVIEDLTGSYISVYGKTVSVIGEAESAEATRKAIEALLRGAKHGNVYKSLEIWKKKRRLE